MQVIIEKTKIFFRRNLDGCLSGPLRISTPAMFIFPIKVALVNGSFTNAGR
jgi:hypothetical protein